MIPNSQFKPNYSSEKEEKKKEEEVPINDEFVISGISGRFPECANVGEFEKNLFDGIDMITDDGRRWSPGLYGLPRRTGKLKELDKFDAAYFGVSFKQADCMDPQLRILMELTHEAMMDAGVNPITIRGSRTGVFIGASGNEANHWSSPPQDINGYEGLGTECSMLSNRISFNFDLRGPSLTVDTACSSSIAALNEAMKALKMGDCDGAIVGGVNVSLIPQRSLQSHRLGMFSGDGKCKSFDASADGYARSEAAVVIFVQKKSTTFRHYATILHVKLSSDGYKEEGITFPSGPAQKKLLQEVYREANLGPAQVTYVEAHGTGTKAGDKQELNAIADVFCQNKNHDDPPLLIGSVKSNMGHSEPASGLCGIAKIIVALRRRQIPANLHYKTANPEIPALSDGRLTVVSKHTKLTGGGLIGLTSLGFGGTNSHVILLPNSKIDKPPPSTLPMIIPISGQTQESVQYTMDQLLCSNEVDQEVIGLFQKISEVDIPGHFFRGYTVVQNGGKDQQISPIKIQQKPSHPKPPPLWFIFSGMGSQRPPIYWRDLMQFKIFEESIHQCAAVLKLKNFDLLDLIQNGDESWFTGNIFNSSISLVAVQVALVQLLGSVGLRPDGILGHSVGELACAFADGSLTAEQTVLAAHARGQAVIASNLVEGGMAAVGLSWDQIKLRCPPEIFPACHNSKDNCTVAGPAPAIKKFVQCLQSESIFAKIVDSTGLAFHSPYIADAGPRLRQSLEVIIPNPPKPRSSTWISTSVPESLWGSPLAQNSSVDYHVNNFLSPVLFADALTKIPKEAVVIEIAPHAILQPILKRGLPPTCTNMGLLTRNRDDGGGQKQSSTQFLEALGQLFNLGFHPIFRNLYENDVKFPISIQASFLSPMIQWDHTLSWRVPRKFNKNDSQNKEIQNGEALTEISLDDPKNEFYAGHKIDGRIIFPAAGYLVLVWKAFAKMEKTSFDLCPVSFENLTFHEATFLPSEGRLKISVNIFRTSGQFQVEVSGKSVAASGTVRLNPGQNFENRNFDPVDPKKEHFLPLTKKDAYKELRLRGYEYGGEFQGIQKMDNEGQWARLDWTGNWVTLLDSMLQVIILNQPLRSLQLPSRLQKIVIDPTKFFQLTQGQRSKTTDKVSSSVETIYDKNTNEIRSPGIKISGLKTSLAPKRVSDPGQGSPLLEEYIFTPNFDDTLSTPWPFQKALKFCVDLVMENSMTSKLKMVEMVAANKGGDENFQNSSIPPIFAPIVKKIISSQPNLQSDIVMVTSDPKMLNGGGDVIDNENFGIKINPEMNHQDPHVIIAHDEKDLHVTESLKPGAFLIFHSSIKKDEKEEPLKMDELASKIDCHFVASKKILSPATEILCLFRKKFDDDPSKRSPVYVQVNHDNFEWVNQLKSEVNDCEKTGQKIFLISTNNPKSGLMGLINCLKLEPGGQNVRAFFVPEEEKDENLIDKVIPADFVMNVYQKGIWGSYRLFPLDFDDPTSASSGGPKLAGIFGTHTRPLDDHAFVHAFVRGDLSTLRWVEGPLNRWKDEKAQKNLCQVHYAAINFRDVVYVSGKLPADALPSYLAGQECLLGIEYSGLNLVTGQRVMGCAASKGMATLIESHPVLTWEVPAPWSLSQAATIPIAYSTAYYALLIRGKISPGESILIHTGGSTVGQAAIAVALSLNCTVYTTVGSQEKREYLKKRFPQLTDHSFANSRDTTFEHHIQTQTMGQGVDLILNSLAGDKFQASLRCLKLHGRFLEIGKLDLSLNSQMGTAMFLKNVQFHGIVLDVLFDLDYNKDKKEVVTLVHQGIRSGVVRPLDTIIFSRDEIEPAMRFMAQGNHVGKVLLQIREEGKEDLKNGAPTLTTIPQTYFHPTKSYIVVGGLGGFGLELANWLVGRGAKNLVLVSRSGGPTTGYQDLCLRRWRRDGVTVLTPKNDLTTIQGTIDLLEETRVGLGEPAGIFNLALVLSIDLIQNQNSDRFESVCRPKVMITENLDVASRELGLNLDFFVTFSSVVSSRGSPGQTSYGYANSVMERICEQRQKDGLSGLAVQFGAVGDVGVVAEASNTGPGYTSVETHVRGTWPQKIQSCLKVLDYFMQQNRPVVGSCVVADLEKQKMAPLLTKNGGGGSLKAGAGDVKNGPSLMDSVAYILGLRDSSSVNFGTSLADMGLDSLMAVEVKQLLERELDLILSSDEIRRLTFQKLDEMDRQNSDSVNDIIRDQDNSEKSPVLPPERENEAVDLEMSQNSEAKPKNRILYLLCWLGAGAIFLLFLFSLILRQVSRFYLKLRFGPHAKIMDRNLDPLFTLQPQNSSVLINLKCVGWPDKEKIMKIFEKRVLNWSTTMRLDGQKGHKNIQKPYIPYDLLRWKISKNLLFHYWQRHTEFRIEDHFVFDQLQNCGDDPVEICLDKESRKISQFYLTHPLPTDRPSWEIRILESPPSSSSSSSTCEPQFILIFALNHAYGDAATLANLLEFSLADHPPKQSFSRSPENFEDDQNQPKSLLPQKLFMVRSIFDNLHIFITRMIEMYQDCRKNFKKNRPTLRRCYGMRLDLSQFRKVRNPQNGKPFPFLTIIFACLSKAYEESYKSHKEGEKEGQKPPEKLTSIIPYTKFQPTILGLVNNVVPALASFPMFKFGDDQLLDELHHFQTILENAASPQMLEATWHVTSIFSSLAKPFLPLARLTPPFSLVVSNVPFRLEKDFSIFEGQKVIQVSGFPPIWEGAHGSLGCAIYAGTLTLSLVVDESPGRPMENFFKFFQQQLNHLVKITNDGSQDD